LALCGYIKPKHQKNTKKQILFINRIIQQMDKQSAYCLLVSTIKKQLKSESDRIAKTLETLPLVHNARIILDYTPLTGWTVQTRIIPLQDKALYKALLVENPDLEI
jgi:hypothetical protein